MIRTMSSDNYINSDYRSGIAVIPDGNIDKLGNLIPALSFNKIDDVENMSQEEIRNYVDAYYTEVLSKIDAASLASDLRLITLVSADGPLSLRYLTAAYLHFVLNEDVKDIEINDGKLVRKDIPNETLSLMEETIKNHTNMQGFQSIYALNLYRQALEYEKHLKSLDEYDDENYVNELKNNINFLKKLACRENEKYIENISDVSYSKSRKYVRTKKMF